MFGCVGEEDYVFSFAELSLPCGSGAIEGVMHGLSARRAEPLEVSWAGEESVWEEVKRRSWCGLSVGDDDDDDDDDGGMGAGGLWCCIYTSGDPDCEVR